MSDLLARLAARALGQLPAVQPRVRSRYEPAPSLAAEVPSPAPALDAAEGPIATEGTAAASPAEAPAGSLVPARLRAKPAAPEAMPLPPVARSAEATEIAAELEGEPAAVAETRSVRPGMDTGSESRRAESPLTPERRPAAAAPERQRAIASISSRSGAAGSSPAAQAVQRPPRPSQEPPPAVPAPFAAPRSGPALPPCLADPAAAGGGRERAGIEAAGGLPPHEVPAPETEAPSGAEILVERSPLVPRATLRERPVRPGTGLPATDSRRERGPTAAAEPVVRVTIGRIEVRAAPPPPPAAILRPAAPRLTLEEYLRRRHEGRM